MPTIDQYKTNDKLRLLLQGPSGSGKTTLASQFPKPWIFDFDVNLGGTIKWLTNHHLPLPVGYDIMNWDEEGKEVPVNLRYSRFIQKYNEAVLNPEIETLVLDSGTNLAPLLIDDTLREQGKRSISDYKDQRQFWGFFANKGRLFMATLATARKHVVLICHERTNTLENGAIVYPIKIAWPGQVGENIGVFFTDVWRCEVKTIPSGMTSSNRWSLRTQQDHMYELKNSRGLPAVFDFSWKTIEESLK